MTNRHDEQKRIRRGISLLVDQAPIARDFDDITNPTFAPLPLTRPRPVLMFVGGFLVVGALVVVAAVLAVNNGPRPHTMSVAGEDSSCPGASRQPGTMGGGPDEIVDQLRYVPTIDLPLLEQLNGWSVDYGTWCHSTPGVAMIRWEDPRVAAAGIVVWEDIDQPDPEHLGDPADEGLWANVSYAVNLEPVITVNGQNDGRWFQVVGRGDLDEVISSEAGLPATVIEAATHYRATGDLQLDRQVWEDVTPPVSGDPVPAVVWYLDARNPVDVFTASVMLRPDFDPKAAAAERVFGCGLVDVPTASGTAVGVLCGDSITWEISPGVVADISGDTLHPDQIIATAGSMTLISETDAALPPLPPGDR